jgi:hypothetical protein
MAARDFAPALIAAVGLYVALDALLEVVGVLQYWVTNPTEPFDASLVALLAAPLAGALLLGGLTFLGAGRLARFAPDARAAQSLDHEDADPARLAFVAIGAYFAVSGVAWGVPEAISRLVADPENWRDPALQAYGLMALLGTALCLGASGLAGGIAALRRLGRDRR